MTKKSLYIKFLLIIGVVIIINLITNEFFLRLDFTERKEYTLSKATENILLNREDPITIKAYFSGNMPPQIQKTKKDFQELLVEYATISKGMIAYSFIDPNENEENEKKAVENGIYPVNINVREKNEMKVQKAYMGAVIYFRDKKELLPIIQVGSSMEYMISSSIKKLSAENKTDVAIYNTGIDLKHLSQSISQLNMLYNIQSLDLDTISEISDTIKTLAIINPSDTVIDDKKLKKVDDFLNKGGRVFIAFNNTSTDINQMYTSKINNKLTNWLESKEIKTNSNIVSDMKCVVLNVQQQRGGYMINSQVPFPYIFYSQEFSNSPISKGLTNVVLSFVSSLEFLGDTNITKYSPLMYSSEKSKLENLPLQFNLQRNWTENDFTESKISIGASIEGKALGNENSKMVIINDGKFALSEQDQDVMPDNVSLLVNSIDWLSDDTGLIELRTKVATYRGLKTLSDGKKEFIKYLNFLLPILIILIFSVARFQYKKKQSLKRKLTSYE